MPCFQLIKKNKLKEIDDSLKELSYLKMIQQLFLLKTPFIAVMQRIVSIFYKNS